MERSIVATDRAPSAIGSYSQAARVGSWVFVSGQIPLDPQTMTLVEGGVEASIRRDLADLADFPLVNQVMAELFAEPYPARAAVGVAALPLGARLEMDAILVLPS